MHKGSSGRTRYAPVASQSAPSIPNGLRTPARLSERPGRQHDTEAEQQDHRPGEPCQRAPSPRRKPPVREQQQDVSSQESHRWHPYPVAYPGHHDREGNRPEVAAP